MSTQGNSRPLTSNVKRIILGVLHRRSGIQPRTLIDRIDIDLGPASLKDILVRQLMQQHPNPIAQKPPPVPREAIEMREDLQTRTRRRHARYGGLRPEAGTDEDEMCCGLFYPRHGERVPFQALAVEVLSRSFLAPLYDLARAR